MLLALGGLRAKLRAKGSLATEVGATTLVLHAEVGTALTALHAELRALRSLGTELGTERGLATELRAKGSLTTEVGATTLALHEVTLGSLMAEVRTTHARLAKLRSLSTKLGAERSLATEVGAATLALHTAVRTALALLIKLGTLGAEGNLTLELRSGLRHLGSYLRLRGNNGLLGGNLRLLRSCLLSHEGHGYEQSK